MSMPLLRGKTPTVARIVAGGLVPNFAADDADSAIAVAHAVHDGGCDVLEFLNRGRGALGVFERLAEHVRSHLPSLLLGAGTITEAGSAAGYANAGATFLVAPNLNAEVARFAHRRGLPYIPGCQTPSEVSDALALGCDIVKVFPAGPLGPAWLRATLGPIDHAMFMPSNGIDATEESIGAWFEAGCACVSLGSNLFPAAAMSGRDWPAIRANVARAMEIIRRVRRD